jgi:hypothetical protein
MNVAPTITCVFFNDATVPVFLNGAKGRPLAGDLLVECALRPTLGFALNIETPAGYPGVAGLLGGVDLGTLAHPNDQLPAPIIFAPGAAVSAAALRSGVERLKRPDERLRAITLLVPVSDARALGGTLAIAERYAIAWNISSYPHEELIEFGRWLAAESLLTSRNFAGCFGYSPTAVEREHAAKTAALFDEFPALKGGLTVEQL